MRPEGRVMKATFIFIIMLLMIMSWIYSPLSQNQKSVPSEFLVNHKQSRMLIDRFNALRKVKNLQRIEHDTVLDNIAKILLTDKTKSYRKSTNVYNEDSVRLLFYNKGIIDYQYEIKEISDRDTASVFKDFVLADKWNHIRAGYYRTENKHILLKTKSYLKFDHWFISVHSEPIDPLNNGKIAKINVNTDSIIAYFMILTPGKYYYQFYDSIPVSGNKLSNVKKYEVHTTSGSNASIDHNMHDLIIRYKDTNVFLIISNEDNERIAVVK